jgi:hypothetical protein
MELTWQDPPPAKRGRGSMGRWRVISEALQEVPGKWALILERCDKKLANTARKSLIRYGAEVAQRSIDGGFDLYARWPELGA